MSSCPGSPGTGSWSTLPRSSVGDLSRSPRPSGYVCRSGFGMGSPPQPMIMPRRHSGDGPIAYRSFAGRIPASPTMNAAAARRDAPRQPASNTCDSALARGARTRCPV